MKLTPPKQIVFWISVVVAVLGLIVYFAVSPLVGFILTFLAFALLAVALLVKGL